MIKRKSALFIALDDRFAQFAWPFFRALRRIWPHHPEILVAYLGSSPAIRTLLEAQPRVSLVSVPEKLPVGPVMAHLAGKVDPRVFYARLLLWSGAFNDFGNILHLDVDTLILAPLDDLLQSQRMLMFPEVYQDCNPIFVDHDNAELILQLNQDGIQVDAQRGNAGVFTLPHRFRSAAGLDEMVQLLERYGQYLRWADQSLINVWMLKRQIPVSQEIANNFQLRALRFGLSAFSAARVLHFNGVDDQMRILLMESCLELLEANAPKGEIYSLLNSVISGGGLLSDCIRTALASNGRRVSKTRHQERKALNKVEVTYADIS